MTNERNWREEKSKGRERADIKRRGRTSEEGFCLEDHLLPFLDDSSKLEKDEIGDGWAFWVGVPDIGAKLKGSGMYACGGLMAVGPDSIAWESGGGGKRKEWWDGWFVKTTKDVRIIQYTLSSSYYSCYEYCEYYGYSYGYYLNVAPLENVLGWEEGRVKTAVDWYGWPESGDTGLREEITFEVNYIFRALKSGARQ